MNYKTSFNNDMVISNEENKEDADEISLNIK